MYLETILRRYINLRFSIKLGNLLKFEELSLIIYKNNYVFFNGKNLNIIRKTNEYFNFFLFFAGLSKLNLRFLKFKYIKQLIPHKKIR